MAGSDRIRRRIPDAHQDARKPSSRDRIAPARAPLLRCPRTRRHPDRTGRATLSRLAPCLHRRLSKIFLNACDKRVLKNFVDLLVMVYAPVPEVGYAS